MKKEFSIATLLLFVSMLSPALAYQSSANEQKEYVAPEDILILREGIFALINGQPVPVSIVGQDEFGTYCMAKFEWTCPKCSFVNEWWRTRCGKCGY